MNRQRLQRIVEEATEIATELSGYDAKDIAPDTQFLALGFDSLFLTQYAASIERAFGVKTTFRQLIEDTTTMNSLAERIDATMPAEPAAPEPSPTPPAGPAATMGDVDAVPAMNKPDSASPPPAARAIPSNGLPALFTRQLELMEEQLKLLRGASRPFSEDLASGHNQASKVDHGEASPLAATPASKDQRSLAEIKGVSAPVMNPGAAPAAGGAAASAQFGERQRDHIQRLVDRYSAKTAGSRDRIQAHRHVFADPRTASGFTPLWKEMVYPLVVERSEGAYLWDVDGNRYVDLLNGFGPNYFGHRAPFVVEAIRRQLDEGFEVGPQSPAAGEAAELFCELTGMARVSFVNTGSEAVQAALRVARTVTGRDKAVCFAGSYHGNFDEVLVGRAPTAPGRTTLPAVPGVPRSATSNMIVLEYGAEAALDEIRRRADEIAIVMVEPVQSRRPEFRPREFIRALRDITEEKGIVLHFDEVITGFRMGARGAQGFYGVEADIATYGKVLAGGMPIGAVAGAKRFMDTFDGGAWRYGDASKPTAGVTFFAGTFVRHPFAVAAARACLSYMKSAGPGLQDGVNRVTDRFVASMNELFSLYGAKFELPHCSSQMFLRTAGEGQAGDLFAYHFRERGVHLLENYPSYMTAAHTDSDIEFVLEAADSALEEMRRDGMFSAPRKPSGVRPASLRRISLTHGQQEIYVASALGPAASCAYNESISLRIDGDLDAARLMAAITASVEAQEAFRLRFDDSGETSCVAQNAGAVVELEDVSGLDPERRRERVTAYCDDQAVLPFDLACGPLIRVRLFRMKEDEHVLVVYTHHIVFDGYSANLLFRDIKSRYEEGSGLATLKPFGVYANYAGRPSVHAGFLAAWKDAFTSAPLQPLALPEDSDADGARRGAGATIIEELPPMVGEAADRLARSAGVGSLAVFLAAYGALLQRLSGAGEVVVGVPSAGQAVSGIETIGFCVSMWPIRVSAPDDASFGDLARAAQRSLNEASERPDVAMGELAAALGLPFDPERPPIVHAALNVTRYFNDLKFGGAVCTPFENRRRAAQYDLFLGLRRGPGRLDVDCDYDSGRYREEMVRSWIAALMRFLEAADADHSATICSLLDVAGVPSRDERVSKGVPAAVTSVAPEPTPARAEASGPTEAAVIEAMAAALGVKVSPDDNFFDLGGQSLKAVRLVAALRENLGRPVELAWLFDAEDLRAFAQRIDADGVSARAPAMEIFEF